jgi:hypothetical protein
MRCWVISRHQRVESHADEVAQHTAGDSNAEVLERGGQRIGLGHCGLRRADDDNADSRERGSDEESGAGVVKERERHDGGECSCKEEACRWCSLADKYLGLDHYPWHEEGQVEVTVTINPTRITGMGT